MERFSEDLNLLFFISKPFLVFLKVKYQMKYLKKQLPSGILKLMYQALIECRLSYGILAWGSDANKIGGL